MVVWVAWEQPIGAAEAEDKTAYPFQEFVSNRSLAWATSDSSEMQRKTSSTKIGFLPFSEGDHALLRQRDTLRLGTMQPKKK